MGQMIFKNIFGRGSTQEASTRSNIESPDVPLTSANVLNYLGVQQSESGQRVNSSSALTLSPVWQAVKMISNDVARLPLNVHKRDTTLGENGRVIDKDHNAYYAMRRQANERVTAYKLWRRAMVHLLIFNRAFVWVYRDKGKIKLYNLLPDRTAIDPKTDMYVTEYDSGSKAKLKVLDPSEVLELEGISIKGGEKCELVAKARNSWGNALAVQGFKAKYFKNKTHAGGFLEIPAHFTKEAADKLEVGFKKVNSNQSDWFRTVILRDGAKFHQATNNAKDAQLTEASESDAREVARWYNLAPSKLGVQDSVSYGSKSEDNEAYFDQTLSEYCMTIQTECWSKCLSEDEKRNDTHVIEHNVRALLATSPQAQADIGNTELQMGATTWNEYRAATNRNPVPGGDVRLVPMNMQMIDKDGNLIAPPSSEPVEPVETEPTTETTEPETEAPIDDARQVAKANLTRCMQRITSTVKKESNRKSAIAFCNWWDNSDLIENVKRDIKPTVAIWQFTARAKDLSADEFFDGIKERINQVLNQHNEESLRQGLSDLCFDLAQIDLSADNIFCAAAAS